ncbi:MAG: glycosyltransferase family 9 protein [Bacteroidales bacterium]|nr:glycosyltransferase family 9 protein [Bacteroidales bacterium]
MEKILVIQTASTGDVILLTSLLEKLHHKFPQAQLDVLVKKPNHKLFDSHPFINNVWVWDKSDKKYLRLLVLCQEIRKEGYDVVFCVQRFFSAGLITLLSKAKKRVGFYKNPLSCFFTHKVEHKIEKGIHEVDRNISLMEGYWCNTAPQPRLYPSKEDYSKTSVYKQGNYYTLSPASLWQTKTLEADKWIELADSMPEESMLYLLGSASDKSLCEYILKKTKHVNTFNLSGKLSLLQSAALMKDAKMNYTNDSAPLHLCSAVDAAVTAVFCSTTLDFGFGPLSSNSVAIEAQPTPSCKPCGLHGAKKCKNGSFACSRNIDIKQLIDRL